MGGFYENIENGASGKSRCRRNGGLEFVEGPAAHLYLFALKRNFTLSSTAPASFPALVRSTRRRLFHSFPENFNDELQNLSSIVF